MSVLASAHETLRLCTRLGLVSALRLHTHSDLENAMFTKAHLLQSLRQQVAHWRIKVDMQFVTSLPSVFSKRSPILLWSGTLFVRKYCFCIRIVWHDKAALCSIRDTWLDRVVWTVRATVCDIGPKTQDGLMHKMSVVRPLGLSLGHTFLTIKLIKQQFPFVPWLEIRISRIKSVLSVQCRRTIRIP